jgi:hypothetical protein
VEVGVAYGLARRLLRARSGDPHREAGALDARRQVGAGRDEHLVASSLQGGRERNERCEHALHRGRAGQDAHAQILTIVDYRVDYRLA